MGADSYYIMRAIELARKGIGRTSPNPPVGAVIVKDRRIIGEGYHKKAGLPHAEIEAINDAMSRGEALAGATMYVTLEPCCTFGRTPPCTSAIIKHKLARVVVGTLDPNPNVSGKGIKLLRASGISVSVGIMENECKELIEPFKRYIINKRAFLAVKLAASLDGKIATQNGDSKWITSEESREFVHTLRDQYDVVMIGAGTLIKDNPLLTVRLVNGRNPVRIIIAGRTPIPSKARLFHDNAAQTIVVLPVANPFDGKHPEGVDVWSMPNENGVISMRNILEKIAQEGWTSVLMEGGAATAMRSLQEKVVDRLYLFTAPILIGEGISIAGDLNVNTVPDAMRFRILKRKEIGGDMLTIAAPIYTEE